MQKKGINTKKQISTNSKWTEAKLLFTGKDEQNIKLENKSENLPYSNLT